MVLRLQARCAQLNAHASALWSDNLCALPLASVCKAPRTLFNTSTFTPPLALAEGAGFGSDLVTTVTTPSQLEERAGAAAAAATACAVVDIEGRAVLPGVTNVTGRYVLEPVIHQGFPVYRRVLYYPPARSASAAGDK